MIGYSMWTMPPALCATNSALPRWTASVEGQARSVGASGALIHYVKQTQKAALEHITGLSFHETANYLVLDPATVRNLELVESSDGDTKDTLLAVINRTTTGMGARLVRNWLLRPSVDALEIESRLDAVGEVVASPMLLARIRDSFEGIFDLERLLGKITVGTSSPRELTALRGSICSPARSRQGAQRPQGRAIRRARAQTRSVNRSS